ncbi:hypothetical protein TgHK011_002283 [Trichoderma gracile]|nr:hypothetical protein TgHK011_002283 [Trichoderma gracile]
MLPLANVAGSTISPLLATPCCYLSLSYISILDEWYLYMPFSAGPDNGQRGKDEDWEETELTPVRLHVSTPTHTHTHTPSHASPALWRCKSRSL